MGVAEVGGGTSKKWGWGRGWEAFLKGNVAREKQRAIEVKKEEKSEQREVGHIVYGSRKTFKRV